MTPLLRVDGLATEFATEQGLVRAVDGVDLRVRRGEILGLVGESGSGKTVTALSILRLIPPPGHISAGRILFDGTDILRLNKREMLRLRGRRISMIFQQPKACLNPVIRVGRQVAGVLRLHHGMTPRAARDRTLELLTSVGIPAPEQKMNAYPHELSGGQAQRIMIAAALALEPQLLIADEPTTALDVTIQAQVLHLLKEMCQRTGTALILVTHDMGVVAQTADHVAVMYAGQIVEDQPVADLFAGPAHPYTRSLLGALPRPGTARTRLQAIPGAAPVAGTMPAGCRFAPRCSERLDACTAPPPVMPLGRAGALRCWGGEHTAP